MHWNVSSNSLTIYSIFCHNYDAIEFADNKYVFCCNYDACIQGGWNNIRMGMETAVVMALAMGRTLVMPPEQKMYLLTKSKKGQKHQFSLKDVFHLDSIAEDMKVLTKSESQKHQFTFKDFFHFDSIAVEHEAVDVISFEDFLKREAMTGNLHDKSTGAVSFPPKNQTNWDGQLVNYEAGKFGVMAWLRTVTRNVDWDWGKCLAGFPKEAGAEASIRLRDIHLEVMTNESAISQDMRHQRYMGNPTPVDAAPAARISEMMADRRELCLFDETMQQEKFIHLMGDNDSHARMLVHFYVFLFFEDWRHDLWMKRFVRDHLRYVDEIQCAAARVVQQMRLKSRTNGDPSGEFYTMHIRRGDFQYKDTRVEADVIYENSRPFLKENATVYIATDERDKKFFDLFRKHYHIYFLDDFDDQTFTLNTNFYGMLDQLIASRGKVFMGTFYSTFTGYINRLRGYHSQKQKLEGYETGALNSYYYIPRNKIEDVRQFRSFYQPFWGREFPGGWRDLEHGLGEDMVVM